MLCHRLKEIFHWTSQRSCTWKRIVFEVPFAYSWSRCPSRSVWLRTCSVQSWPVLQNGLLHMSVACILPKRVSACYSIKAILIAPRGASRIFTVTRAQIGPSIWQSSDILTECRCDQKSRDFECQPFIGSYKLSSEMYVSMCWASYAEDTFGSVCS